MHRLGRFESPPRLAVAVSGGADSMALAVLARDWAGDHDAQLTALIVDHGLRAESADEARMTAQRLAALNIRTRVLRLADLRRGSALADRAREARYDALIAACQAIGCPDLLLGHHAGDQVETVAMRALRLSRNDGLAGMSAVRETRGVRLLRPLLHVHPSRLRAFLTDRGVDWLEDPSNLDMNALRPRLRRELSHGSWDALLAAVAQAGARRALNEARAAQALARHVTVHPEGYAVVNAASLPPHALSSLLTAIAGAAYPPDPDLVAGLAAHLAPATLHGVRVMPAGRLGDGWLVVREEAAVQPPIAAAPHLVWDRRFAVSCADPLPKEATIGRLGNDAAGFRRLSRLPSVVLRTLPALRIGKKVEVVPHLGYSHETNNLHMTVTFTPPIPAEPPVFVPPTGGYLGLAEPVASGSGQSPGCDSPLHGGPSTRVGMQGRIPHTIYQGAASGSPNLNSPRCPNPIEDVSKLI